MTEGVALFDLILRGATFIAIIPLYYVIGQMRKDIEWIKRELNKK